MNKHSFLILTVVCLNVHAGVFTDALLNPWSYLSQNQAQVLHKMGPRIFDSVGLWIEKAVENYEPKCLNYELIENDVEDAHNKIDDKINEGRIFDKKQRKTLNKYMNLITENHFKNLDRLTFLTKLTEKEKQIHEEDSSKFDTLIGYNDKIFSAVTTTLSDKIIKWRVNIEKEIQKIEGFIESNTRTLQKKLNDVENVKEVYDLFKEYLDVRRCHLRKIPENRLALPYYEWKPREVLINSMNILNLLTRNMSKSYYHDVLEEWKDKALTKKFYDYLHEKQNADYEKVLIVRKDFEAYKKHKNVYLTLDEAKFLNYRISLRDDKPYEQEFLKLYEIAERIDDKHKKLEDKRRHFNTMLSDMKAAKILLI